MEKFIDARVQEGEVWWQPEGGHDNQSPLAWGFSCRAICACVDCRYAYSLMVDTTAWVYEEPPVSQDADSRGGSGFTSSVLP